jgi:hypothetical protein
MATLIWDAVGDRTYQTGIDRGVLYLPDGTGVAWNGLIDMEESSTNEMKSYYLDGVKYLEAVSPGEFIGKLKAFTYPEEFDALNGLAAVAPGFNLHNQPPRSFNLSYRTKVGNDIEGLDHGYKIHILYNVIANPESSSFGTIQESSIGAIEFGWTLTGTPPKIASFRPTVHISIDSRTTPPDVLQMLENKLYGTLYAVRRGNLGTRTRGRN